MSEQENKDKELKKIGPLTLNKKKLIKIIVGAGILSACAFGIYNYLNYKHQVFLEQHSQAIADLKDKNKSGYNNAFSLLKDLAEDSEASPDDYFYLGLAYQYGLGTSKDYANAYKYYKKASKANNSQAFYQLATLYQDGLGVNKDNKKAIQYFQKAYELGLHHQSITALSKLTEANNRVMSMLSPEFLYNIYLAYKSNDIPETDPTVKEKYLITAAAEGYEPAIIIQAKNFAKNGDNYRALMLWQTLLYSSNKKISELAKKEIPKIETLVKEQREKEIQKQKQLKIQQQKEQQRRLIEKAKREKEIQYKRNAGLSIPKQKISNLSGLMYINLFNIDKNELQKFYTEITGIESDSNFFETSKSMSNSYINKFLKLSKLKHNRSSLKIDFGDKSNTNKYEGIVYYLYNNKDKTTQEILSQVIKNNKPKTSSLKPKIQTINHQQAQAKKKEQEQAGDKDKQKAQVKKQNKQKTIQLTHEEKIQRMQIFAQKGDFRQFYKLEQAARAGDVYAMYYVGEYYYNDKEYKEALKYYNKAADKNFGPAYYKLASLYYNEEKNGVPYNKEKAMKYYKKAAELGVRNAKHILMLIQ